MWSVQMFDGFKMLPELIVDAEMSHDAERTYAEHFGLDADDIRLGRFDEGEKPYVLIDFLPFAENWDLQAG